MSKGIDRGGGFLVGWNRGSQRRVVEDKRGEGMLGPHGGAA